MAKFKNFIQDLILDLNADRIDGCDVNDISINTSSIWTSDKINSSFASFISFDSSINHLVLYNGLGNILSSIELNQSTHSLTTDRFLNPPSINGVLFDGFSDITIEDPTKLPLLGGTVTGDVIIRDTNYSFYSDNTDITSLIPGTISGTLIEGVEGSHFVIGLKDNNINDSFSIISGGGLTGTSFREDNIYDKLCFRVRADGMAYFTNNVDIDGSLTITNGRVTAYGDAYFTNNVDIDGFLAIRNGIESYSRFSGAFTVQGGIGVSGNIYCNDMDCQTLKLSSIDVGRGSVYIENNSYDNVDGAGITLRTSGNPVSGSIFSVRSGGGTSRFWVGHGVTSSGQNSFYVGTDIDGNSNPYIVLPISGDPTVGGNKMWHEGNHGTGSGLDADLLDGLDSTQFLRSDIIDEKISGYTRYNDNVSIYFGSENDSQIFRSTVNWHLRNYTGGIFIQQHVNEGDIILEVNDSQGILMRGLYIHGNIGTRLYHVKDGTEKLRTLSDGIQVYGYLKASTGIQTEGHLTVSSYIQSQSLFSNHINISHTTATRNTDTIFYSSTDDSINRNTKEGFRASLDVPSREGIDATGTWNINISGVSNTTSKLETARDISLTGDVVGSGNFDGSTDITISSTLSDTGVIAGIYNDIPTEITPITIDSKGRITSVGLGVTITPDWSSIINIPTDIVYTSNSYNDPSWLTISKAKVGLINVQNISLSTWQGSTNINTIGDVTANSVTILGDLIVNGSSTVINSNIVTIDDPIFTLGGDTQVLTDDNKDRGIEFKWNDGIDSKVGFFGFDDSTGYFIFIKDGINSSEIFSGSLGDIQASNFRGDLVGNASSANILSNSRLINGIPFDGSSDITIEDPTKLSITGAVSLNISSLPTQHDLLSLGDVWIDQFGYIRSKVTDTRDSNEHIFRYYNETSDPDINSLVPGSNFGNLIVNPSTGHIVIGLRANDIYDSFSIVTTDLQADPHTFPYTSRLFSVSGEIIKYKEYEVWHHGNLDPTTSTFYAFDDTKLPLVGGTVTGDVLIRGTNYSYFSGDTDITSLVPGSGIGTLIQSIERGQFVIGLRDNDVNDSFSIISGGGSSPNSYHDDNLYDKLCFRVRADGLAYFTNNLDVDGSLIIRDTTQSNSITTGAIRVSGGIGALGNISCNTLIPTGIDIGRGIVYIESNINDNLDGAGITLKTSSNPTSGSIFSVRSSGEASRFWVGHGVTSSGQNHFYIGTDIDGNSNPYIVLPTSGDPTVGGNKIWHDGNTPAFSSSNVPGNLVWRDGNGDFTARYIFSTYHSMSHGVATRNTDTVFYSSTDDYIRKNNATGIISSLGLDGRYLGISAKAADSNLLDGLNSTVFLRKDGTNNSSVTINSQGADFIIQDLTDTTTNYIWRDHSVNALYLGTPNAVPTTRTDMVTKGGGKYWHDGNTPSISTSASNNTLVQRNGSGYIYANYFNTSPNDVSSGITRICCETSNDGFIRHATADAVRTFIGRVDDSNLLDGVNSTQFLRSDVADVKTGGHTRYNDSVETYWGNSADLTVFHDGHHSYIQNNTGYLYIQQRLHGGAILIQAQNTAGANLAAIYARPNYQSLYGDGAEILRVDSNGIKTDSISTLGGAALTIGAGEMGNRLATDGYTAEILYLGGEKGVRAMSSSNNLSTWPESKHEAILIDLAGNSSFPGTILANAVSCGYNPGINNSISCSGWFRSSGGTGWFNATYGGGIHMVDNTWVRIYNGKGFYTGSGTLRTDGEFRVGNNDFLIKVGTNSYIDNLAGHLYYRQATHGGWHYIQAQDSGGTNRACAYLSGSYQRLFWNGSERMITTSGGIDVTGTVSCGAVSNGSANLLLTGNEIILAATATNNTARIHLRSGSSTLDFGWNNYSNNFLYLQTFNNNTTTFRNNLMRYGEAEIRAYAPFVQNSSILLKENIEDLKIDLKGINSLRPVRFNYKGKERKEIGFIAEELKEVYKEDGLVVGEAEESGIDYTKLSVIAIAGIKELTKEINILKEEIKLLKDKINILENK